MFFLHLFEQVHCTCPSFLTSMIPCPLVTCLPQKEQLRRDVAVLLIYHYHLILRASRSVSLSIKYIIHPNRSLDVPCENSASILAFENLDVYLYHFASDPCPAYYLDDFGRDYLFFSCFVLICQSASTYYFGVAATPFIVLIELTTCSTMCWASPASTIVAPAEPTSIPSDAPSSCLLGTKINGAFLSSQRIGRWATTSGGSTSSAITTSFDMPRFYSFSGLIGALPDFTALL